MRARTENVINNAFVDALLNYGIEKEKETGKLKYIVLPVSFRTKEGEPSPQLITVIRKEFMSIETLLGVDVGSRQFEVLINDDYVPVNQSDYLDPESEYVLRFQATPIIQAKLEAFQGDMIAQANMRQGFSTLVGLPLSLLKGAQQTPSLSTNNNRGEKKIHEGTKKIQFSADVTQFIFSSGNLSCRMEKKRKVSHPEMPSSTSSKRQHKR